MQTATRVKAFTTVQPKPRIRSEKKIQSSITAKGQTTIPKAIRDHLRLKAGDSVKFFIHPSGTVVLLPKLPASALRGMLGTPQRSVSLEEMHEAVLEGATSRFEQANNR